MHLKRNPVKVRKRYGSKDRDNDKESCSNCCNPVAVYAQRRKKEQQPDFREKAVGVVGFVPNAAAGDFKSWQQWGTRQWAAAIDVGSGEFRAHESESYNNCK
ncbi:Uncharacterized protein Fot_29703 [Forsythia ovata]|uniref:Uncharacterized protein n=1 Tax=Forsythia ovata TaxID=205694 RepID=A0ABD1TSN5_9LAMI